MTPNILRRSARVACLLLIPVLASFAVPTIAAQNGEMPLTGSSEALALFKQGREKAEYLEDAGTLFDQAVQKDPSFAFAYLFAGRTTGEAQKHLATAVSLADKVSPGEREWIMAASEQSKGNSAARLAHLEQLLKLHPGDKRVHTQLGLYYRNVAGDDSKALMHFNEATKIDKNYAPAYNNIGYSSLDLGRIKEAEAAFKTYIELIPNNPNPYDSYAEFLMRSGKFDDSLKYYNLALAKEPTFDASYRGIGNNYAYKGEYAKSRQAYQTILDKSTNAGRRNQATTSIINSWIIEGNFAKAVEANQARIEAAEKAGDIPTQAGFHNLAVFLSIEAGDMEGAARHLAAAAKLADDPSLPAAQKGNRDFAVQLQRSRYLGARGDFAGARTAIEEAQKFAVSNGNAGPNRAYNLSAGMLELQQKNYVKANEYFSKANQLDPFVWYHQALAHEGAGDAKAANALYRKIADWNRLDNPNYFFVRPRALAKLKK